MLNRLLKTDEHNRYFALPIEGYSDKDSNHLVDGYILCGKLKKNGL